MNRCTKPIAKPRLSDRRLWRPSSWYWRFFLPVTWRFAICSVTRSLAIRRRAWRCRVSRSRSPSPIRSALWGKWKSKARCSICLAIPLLDTRVKCGYKLLIRVRAVGWMVSTMSRSGPISFAGVSPSSMVVSEQSFEGPKTLPMGVRMVESVPMYGAIPGPRPLARWMAWCSRGRHRV